VNKSVDLVYICRDGANEELRYSIRSAVKNFKHDNVWVIGYKPDWYQGSFVSVPNIGAKFDNIVNCIRAIPEIPEISDDFVLMNDDFFFLKPITELPIYHGGLLSKKIEQYLNLGTGKYGSLLNRTYRSLIKLGINRPLDYDIHIPMPMNKDSLRKVVKLAYFPRSAYGNINSIGGELVSDVKTYGANSIMSSRSYDFVNGDAMFVSTEDSSFEEVHRLILRDMFSLPSTVEAIV
jgi:hypothetical protein